MLQHGHCGQKVRVHSWALPRCTHTACSLHITVDQTCSGDLSKKKNKKKKSQLLIWPYFEMRFQSLLVSILLSVSHTTVPSEMDVSKSEYSSVFVFFFTLLHSFYQPKYTKAPFHSNVEAQSAASVRSWYLLPPYFRMRNPAGWINTSQYLQQGLSVWRISG